MLKKDIQETYIMELIVLILVLVLSGFYIPIGLGIIDTRYLKTGYVWVLVVLVRLFL